MGKINKPGQDLDNLSSNEKQNKATFVATIFALAAMKLITPQYANAEGNKIPDEIVAQIEGAQLVTKEELNELCGKLPLHTKFGRIGCKNAIQVKINEDEIAQSKDEIAQSKDEIAQSKDEIAQSKDEIAKLREEKQELIKDLEILIAQTAKEHGSGGKIPN